MFFIGFFFNRDRFYISFFPVNSFFDPFVCLYEKKWVWQKWYRNMGYYGKYCWTVEIKWIKMNECGAKEDFVDFFLNIEFYVKIGILNRSYWMEMQIFFGWEVADTSRWDYLLTFLGEKSLAFFCILFEALGGENVQILQSNGDERQNVQSCEWTIKATMTYCDIRAI